MRKILGLVVTLALLSPSLWAANGYNNYDCWNGGANALANTTTGNHNIACGNEALQRVTTANFNTALGGKAGKAITTGDSNIAIGYAALAASTTGINNVALGVQALQQATADYNTGLGFKALALTTTGTRNTAVGYLTAQNLTIGSRNLILGNATAGTLTTGDENMIFSSKTTAVDVPAAATSQWLSINDVIVGSYNAPTAGTCGTGPSLATGTSDIRGTVTTGSGATACTLTFATAKANAPTCIVSARSGTPPVYTTSTAALTLSTAAASATYDYFCSGK